MALENTDNHFGKFLGRLRISRGYTNINEYLRNFPLSISAVHYRYLENGSRKVSVDAAQVLCSELQVEAKSFYYNLLKDWLPDDFMDFFVGLSDAEKNDETDAIYQKAVRRVLDSQTLYPSKECCDYLHDHFELMPIVWFIYSVSKASLNDIAKVAKSNGILMSAERIVDEFQRYGLIELDSEGTSATRVKPIISFAHDKLSKQILLQETQRRLDFYVQLNDSDPKDTVVVLSTMCVSDEARQTIYRRIQDFLREVGDAAKSSFVEEAEPSEPVFYSILFAPRPQYRVPIIEEN